MDGGRWRSPDTPGGPWKTIWVVVCYLSSSSDCPAAAWTPPCTRSGSCRWCCCRSGRTACWARTRPRRPGTACRWSPAGRCNPARPRTRPRWGTPVGTILGVLNQTVVRLSSSHLSVEKYRNWRGVCGRVRVPEWSLIFKIIFLVKLMQTFSIIRNLSWPAGTRSWRFYAKWRHHFYFKSV